MLKVFKIKLNLIKIIMKQIELNSKGDKNINLKSNKQKVDELIQKLNDIVGWNFYLIFEELENIELSDNDKSKISEIVLEKVQLIIEKWQWWELDGAREILSFLWVKSIEFTNEWIQNINKLYNRFNYWFLISLSPSLYNGKLMNWIEYDKIEYSREKLRDFGVTEEELTDEFINSLWAIREILVKMYYHRIRIDTKLTINDLLLLK